MRSPLKPIAEKFLGRGNSVEQAAGFVQSLDNSQGTVVDPIFSMRCRLHLGIEKREEVSLITAVASSRDALMAILERYRRPQAVPQAFELAWNHTQLDLRFLRIGPDDVHRYQQLGSALMFPDSTLRAPADRLTQDRAGQSALWAAGISGDLPMVTVAIPDARGLPLLRELLLAHAYLSRRGLRFDLIVLNQEPVSYDRPLSQRLQDQTEAFAGVSMPRDHQAAYSSETGTRCQSRWRINLSPRRTCFSAVAEAVYSIN